jgi:hypothetical protein
MRIFKAIVWWSLTFPLGTSCSMAQSSASRDMRKSCRDFVQGFYEWYVPKAVKESGAPASHLAVMYKSSVFSPDLLRALKEDSQAQAKAKGEIVGLEFDPFLNTQDPSPRYVLDKIISKDDGCLVEVYSISSGKKSAKPAVVAELVFKGGHWMFVNFHYGRSKRSEDENLVSTLKNLRADRQKYSK